MNLDGLQSSMAQRLAKAMASEPRLLILCEWLQGERTVRPLQQAVGMPQSAVSQHLAKLREGDVETPRERQTIDYALASEAVQRLIPSLHAIYCPPGPRGSWKKGKTS